MVSDREWYIQGQLEDVEPSDGYKLKLRNDSGSETHWLNITNEQFDALAVILTAPGPATQEQLDRLHSLVTGHFG